MNTDPLTPLTLAGSVIAVPPVARQADLTWNIEANRRIVQHLEAGGVTTLLYGGNAALAHVSLSEYPALLTMLTDAAGPQTTVVPSIGPSFGQMLDQATILKDYAFPTVMLLPSRDATTPAGLAAGVKRFVDKLGRPIVLYIKHDGMIDVETVQKMANDGLISWIKYAVVRSDTSNDSLLRGLIQAVGPSIIVSGMGEQPAIIHLRDFGLIGFTSGCVCVAPRHSMRMLAALTARDFATAERIRQQFAPLEKLRDAINPVRVLHAAVQLAGIAETGPITPLWSPAPESDHAAIKAAALELLGRNAEG
ncbi:MAG: dihydrodipicolinate synthase family protein [Planctomycetaceae bacterium]|nr:dihydrodipicolinate synthase family protein [Planctomycetaceae bacterium]